MATALGTSPWAPGQPCSRWGRPRGDADAPERVAVPRDPSTPRVTQFGDRGLVRWGPAGPPREPAGPHHCPARRRPSPARRAAYAPRSVRFDRTHPRRVSVTGFTTRSHTSARTSGPRRHAFRSTGDAPWFLKAKCARTAPTGPAPDAAASELHRHAAGPRPLRLGTPPTSSVGCRGWPAGPGASRPRRRARRTRVGTP